MDHKGMDTLASVKIENSRDIYKVVDLLNRTLKGQDLIFGLALEDDHEEKKMIFTIYET
ncbi:YpmA family protein [Evansella sp. AB-rgal1]|uniref:YpmA family protein n=1 Tax=Evansella sp. AB-rgal1 TaxID=3242696 RepID=UPI00359D7392